MLKKKVLSPEVTIEKANAGVRAQQEQFHNMIAEIEKAIETRKTAVYELNKEVASLQAQLQRKVTAIEKALDENTIDRVFQRRIAKLVGQE